MPVAASSEEEEEAVADEMELPPAVNLDLYPPTPLPPPLFLVGIGREIAQNGSNVTDSWPQSSHRRVDLRG